MQNSFWFGSRISDFLFKEFSTHTLPGFISICAGLFALAISYELLVVFQISFKQTSDTLQRWRNELGYTSLQSRERFYTKLKQTLLFTTQVVVSYILMLSVMTYNAYFTGSIAIGGGLGYFLLANSVYELQIFDIDDNINDSGSNHGPSDIKGESHSAEVMKTVAEEISDSVNGMICEAVVERTSSETATA